MIELGFASDFGGQSTKLSEIREGLRRISEAGFTHVHWCHEWDGDYLYAPSEMLQIKSWFDTFGLKAKFSACFQRKPHCFRDAKRYGRTERFRFFS